MRRDRQFRLKNQHKDREKRQPVLQKRRKPVVSTTEEIDEYEDDLPQPEQEQP